MVHGPIAGWEVVRRAGPGRPPRIRMAGFRTAGTAPVDVRVVPHPAVSVALALGDGPRVVDTVSGRQRRGDVALGFLHGAVRVRGTGIECIQVRLSPVVARAVLGVSPAELGNDLASLDDLWGRDARRIRHRLNETPSWEERFSLAEELLLARAEGGRALDPEVVRAWDLLVRTRGRARIDALAADVGWSRKRLWTRFRAQTGIAPKRAAGLIRFDHAAHRLATGRRAAAVAAEAGYADQSHLHRDVVAFSGVTPSTVADGAWMAVDDVAWAVTSAAPAARTRRPGT